MRFVAALAALLLGWFAGYGVLWLSYDWYMAIARIPHDVGASPAELPSATAILVMVILVVVGLWHWSGSRLGPIRDAGALRGDRGRRMQHQPPPPN